MLIVHATVSVGMMAGWTAGPKCGDRGCVGVDVQAKPRAEEKRKLQAEGAAQKGKGAGASLTMDAAYDCVNVSLCMYVYPAGGEKACIHVV